MKKNRIILIIAVIVATFILFLYAYVFRGTGLSKETSDWGAFGTYAALGLSILSISLIYITYCEQRNSNNISRSEHHIATMSNTIIELAEKSHSSLESSYSKFRAHFSGSSYDIPNYEYDGIIRVFKLYYSTAIDYNDSIIQNRLFRYIYHCIHSVLHDKFLKKGDKQSRITEISCMIPECVRIMFFCWLLQYHPKVIREYYELGLFYLNDTSLHLLSDLISYVCTGMCPPKRQHQAVNPDDIIYDDAPDETFNETYLRLTSQKTDNN